MLSITGNTLLFFSSLLLLIDIAPRDLLPSHQKLLRAISELREYHNIYVPTPGINLNFNSAQAHADPQAYEILKKLIIENSALVSDVDWGKAVAIGYAITNISVAQGELSVFRPLYVTQLPGSDDDKMMLLVPVGQLSDLDTWLKAKHRGSLTLAATAFLSIGFLMQLIAGFLHNPTHDRSQKKEFTDGEGIKD